MGNKIYKNMYRYLFEMHLTSLKYVTYIHRISSIADCFSQLLQMPYILVRGNLASYGHKYPWRVLVSGLKGMNTLLDRNK